MLALVTLTLAKSVLSQQTKIPTTHCHANERVQFSCRIGSKVVSLCAGSDVSKPAFLSYRYGLINKIENEFTARPDNKNRFYATVMPANPRAAVKQVWFDRVGIRYLLTECVGGNCPQEGGLAVLRGDRVLMNGKCKYEMEANVGWFSDELVTFDLNSSPWNARSTTELLVIVETDNYLEKLFPSPPGVWH